MSTSVSPSLDEPDEVRDYLLENMAEGYLSDDEGLNVNKFVDEYSRLLEMERNIEEVVREALEGRVQ